MESRTEARQRAKQIHELLSTLEDAPSAISERESLATTLEYFVKKSNACQLTCDDLDGLMRLGMDTADLATEKEQEEWDANPAIRRPYPPGWGGALPGWTYPAQLHPKEVAYMQATIAGLRKEEQTIKRNGNSLRAELEELRAVGDLDPKDAKRYNLTTRGCRDRKIILDT
jgi:hypothetical protein